MRRLVIGLVAAAVGSGVLYLVLSVADRHERASVDKDAHHFVAALARRDASLAPESHEEWVPGVWNLFRRVDCPAHVGCERG